ncbi:hypothetical protein M378DRAFT_867112 [Amanita muscaria Koide BX008]|uniref:Uncharacterized protein n=1 Tax=Amanita muscaria (strain Koide BX008) TaxID=946122 RepID=A0A0C2WXN0_AMAMK|nr:hypothetical protein M378DRAFT_867112 [Amanita muscaria Koide BX008]
MRFAIIPLMTLLFVPTLFASRLPTPPSSPPRPPTPPLPPRFPPSPPPSPPLGPLAQQRSNQLDNFVHNTHVRGRGPRGESQYRTYPKAAGTCHSHQERGCERPRPRRFLYRRILPAVKDAVLTDPSTNSAIKDSASNIAFIRLG